VKRQNIKVVIATSTLNTLNLFFCRQIPRRAFSHVTWVSITQEAHLTAVKRILRYLKGTVKLALKYQQSDDGVLVGYSDADWANDLEDRHSTTGNLFFMAGGAISWLNKKQAVIALLSSEAE